MIRSLATVVLLLLAEGLPLVAAAQAWQDHYIDGGSLKPDVSTGESATTDDTGLARSVQIDAVGSVLTSTEAGGASSVVESGMVIRSQWESAAYGDWSLDGSARSGGSGLGQSQTGQGVALTLRQAGMPFDGGWRADNALGDLNSPDINLARFQSRFYLPTGPMQGVTSEWRGPEELQLVAGLGVPGVYDGILVPDFRVLSGSSATAGAEWSPVPHWTVGGQLIDAHDVDLYAGAGLTPAAVLALKGAYASDAVLASQKLSATTGLVSAAWQDHDDRVQLNLIDGGINGGRNGSGAWLDGAMTRGRLQQSGGLFRIDPGITWGNQLIANDIEGGYYRLGYQSRQWLADVGIDEVRSIDGLGGDTTFVTSDARYQFSRDVGAGLVANLSRSGYGTSGSLQGYVDRQDAWGTTRVQAAFASGPAARDAMVTLDQAWKMPAGLRLATSAGFERADSPDAAGVREASTLLNIAANGGGQLTARFGLEANIRWATAVQGRVAPGLYTNLSLTWQLAPSWLLLATYYDSRIGSWTPLTVTSPLAPPLATTAPAMQERGMFLTVRYQHAAGMHFAPLGGAPGAGSGDLRGIVYLDANDNGRLDAGEAGAPNVTVILDGRFSVQTDATGHFDFPVVVAGRHVVTVVTDNLPLPWMLANDGRQEVLVSTRERTDVAIGARRLR
jgi:hypothetical protein